MASTTVAPLVDHLRQYRLLDANKLKQLDDLPIRFPDPKALAGELLKRGWLTAYQANLLLQGKGHELLLGAYVLLHRLGDGRVGQLYKARHQKMCRTVALKVIRNQLLNNPEAVSRFH